MIAPWLDVWGHGFFSCLRAISRILFIGRCFRPEAHVLLARPLARRHLLAHSLHRQVLCHLPGLGDAASNCDVAGRT